MEMDKYNNRSRTHLAHSTILLGSRFAPCAFALHFISLQLWRLHCSLTLPRSNQQSPPAPHCSSMNSVRNHVFLHTYNKSTLVKISRCIFMCLSMPCVYVIHQPNPKPLAYTWAHTHNTHTHSFVRPKVLCKTHNQMVWQQQQEQPQS